MTRDPIAPLRTELIAHGVLDEAETDAVEVEAKDAMAAGIEFARQSPAPAVTDVTKFVHAEGAA